MVNLNQQSDSADQLGGFRPVSLAHSLHGLRQRFTSAFCSTFSSMDNAKFLAHLDTCFQAHRWEDALQLIRHSLKAAVKKIGSEDVILVTKWNTIKADLKLAPLDLRPVSAADTDEVKWSREQSWPRCSGLLRVLSLRRSSKVTGFCWTKSTWQPQRLWSACQACWSPVAV